MRRTGLRLELLVTHPARGTYQTSTIWLVEEILIPQVQPGKIVAVLLNAIEPKRVYPNVKGAEFNDWALKRLH